MSVPTVCIRTERLPESFWWSPRMPVRGTEEFYVETAKALATRGYRVIVEKEPPHAIFSSLDGASIEFVERATGTQSDVIFECNVRRPAVPSRAPQVLWSNLFGVTADALRRTAGVPPETIVCGVSAFHGKQLDPDGHDRFVRIVPHGVSKASYRSDGELRAAYERQTGRRLALFSSSPDRGLSIVLRLREQLASLSVDVACSNYPGKGSEPLPEDVMRRLYRTAHFWLHPGEGNELFCLAGAKAQAAGCCPIVRATGALRETVQCGYRASSALSVDEWCASVLRHVRLPIPDVSDNHLLTWQDATDRLIGIVKEVSR